MFTSSMLHLSHLACEIDKQQPIILLWETPSNCCLISPLLCGDLNGCMQELEASTPLQQSSMVMKLFKYVVSLHCSSESRPFELGAIWCIQYYKCYTFLYFSCAIIMIAHISMITAWLIRTGPVFQVVEKAAICRSWF